MSSRKTSGLSRYRALGTKKDVHSILIEVICK